MEIDAKLSFSPDNLITVAVSVLAALLIGAGHDLASWNEEFAAVNGQALWRACSIAVMVLL